MTPAGLLPNQPLEASVTRDGYVFVQAPAMREALEQFGPLADWPAFAASWDNLELDRYMADGGQYRRRRHAVYAGASDGTVVRQPHQPHYQSLAYNPLNGGIARWFVPVALEVGQGPTMLTILGFCIARFSRLGPAVDSWKIDVHQFRIETRPGEEGRPTPEGLHRDGVDYVLVLLVNRRNIASGTTTIHALDRRELGRFTLTHPFDAALVDDARVYHGVTAVQPLDAGAAAYRDVLVVTLRRS